MVSPTHSEELTPQHRLFLLSPMCYLRSLSIIVLLGSNSLILRAQSLSSPHTNASSASNQTTASCFVANIEANWKQRKKVHLQICTPLILWPWLRKTYSRKSLLNCPSPPEDILNGNLKQLRGGKGNAAHQEPIKIHTYCSPNFTQDEKNNIEQLVVCELHS